MSYGGRSSACTASTNTAPPPKIPVLSRQNRHRYHPDSSTQTYSAFIEEAQIFDSLTPTIMEPPIRFALLAPSKRFYAAIVLGQLCLVSTVVALVLMLANYSGAYQSDRTSYTIWLVFSAASTFFFALLVAVFWLQRRKLGVVQARLRAMQLAAEAHGSQKRLETTEAGAGPQLRAETDHRHSVLAMQRHFDEATEEAAAGAYLAAYRNSVIAAVNGIGRGRQESSATGEGCELSLFQTHLSNGSINNGVADTTATMTNSAIQTPTPTYESPLQRILQRESTTTRLWQDDPTMQDLFHGLNTNTNQNQTTSAHSAIDTSSTTPSPRRMASNRRRRDHHHATLPFPPSLYSPANRSSTALPFLPSTQHTQPHDTTAANAIDDATSSSSPSPSSSISCHAHVRARAASAVSSSSSPDYGILLPAFPLPPSHARFSEPSFFPPAPPPVPPRSLRRDEVALRRMSWATAPEAHEGRNALEEERPGWGQMMMRVEHYGGPRGVGVRGGEQERGGGLSLRTNTTPTTDGRRDSHVDDDESDERDGDGVDGVKGQQRRQSQNQGFLGIGDDRRIGGRKPSITTTASSVIDTATPAPSYHHHPRSSASSLLSYASRATSVRHQHNHNRAYSSASAPAITAHAPPPLFTTTTTAAASPRWNTWVTDDNNDNDDDDEDDDENPRKQHSRKKSSFSSLVSSTSTPPHMGRGRSASGSRFLEDHMG